MSKSGWSVAEATSALNQVIGLRDEVVFIHSNLALLGRCSSGNSAEAFLAALQTFSRVTFVLPAFDYSFGRNAVFDLKNPPKQMGALSNHAFSMQGVIRSVDPMFSCLLFGPIASDLAANLPSRSFGPNSLFDRVLRSEGSLLSINLDMGSTLCHELEYRSKVPFRYEKMFEGTFAHEPRFKKNWMSYVRDLSLVLTQDFTGISKSLEASGLVAESRIGLGRIRSVKFSQYSSHISSRLQVDPWVMISRLDGGPNAN